MGQVIFRLDAEEAKAVRGFLRVYEAQKKTEQGMAGVTRSSKTAEEGMGKFGRAADREMRALKNLLIGGGGVAGSIMAVGALFGKWTQHLEEFRQKMQQVNTEAAGAQEKVLKLADQMGDTSERGLGKAVVLAGQVARAGTLPDIQTGASIAQSVLSNVEIDRRTATGMMKAISMITGKSGMTEEAAGTLPEFAVAAGMAGSTSDTQQWIAEIAAALKSSASLNAGTFSAAGIKGGAGLLALGTSRQEVLRRMVQARAVSGGSDDKAAEILRRIAQAATRENVAGLISDQTGRRASDLSWDERFGAMQEMFMRAEQDPAFRERIMANFETREQLLFPAFFGQAGRGAYAKAGRAVAGAQWSTVEQQAEAFSQSKLGISRRIAVQKDVRRQAISTEQFAEWELLRQAEQVADENPAAFGGDALHGGREQRIRYIAEQLRGNDPMLGGVPEQGDSFWSGRAFARRGRGMWRIATADTWGDVKSGLRSIFDSTNPEVTADLYRDEAAGPEKTFGGGGASGGRGGGASWGGPAVVNNYYGDRYENPRQDVTQRPEPVGVQ